MNATLPTDIPIFGVWLMLRELGLTCWSTISPQALSWVIVEAKQMIHIIFKPFSLVQQDQNVSSYDDRKLFLCCFSVMILSEGTRVAKTYQQSPQLQRLALLNWLHFPVLLASASFLLLSVPPHLTKILQMPLDITMRGKMKDRVVGVGWCGTELKSKKDSCVTYAPVVVLAYGGISL